MREATDRIRDVIHDGGDGRRARQPLRSDPAPPRPRSTDRVPIMAGL
jgi:hypothetical protein